jgi:hypothetical protein
MQMTNDDIVATYRDAKDQPEQRRILAQLNACPVAKIDEILIKNGFELSLLPPEDKSIRMRPCVDPVKFQELHKKGMNDGQIARAMGVSANGVWHHRTKLNLPSNAVSAKGRPPKKAASAMYVRTPKDKAEVASDTYSSPAAPVDVPAAAPVFNNQ